MLFRCPYMKKSQADEPVGSRIGLHSNGNVTW
jgi:hypothetical protein